MRSSILALIPTVNLGGFSVSQELPFSAAGVELFVKNPKTIYVDRETTESVPLFATLDAKDISNTTTSVVIYFSTDAKNPPSHLENLISNIKGLKTSISQPGANQREVLVRSSYSQDLLINEVEFRFTKIS
jgi:hypothetical protein